MKRVTSKPTTLRRAVAKARIKASLEAIARLEANDLPKKDALAVARVAATAAAKKTSDLIPYCHPIPIDAVEVTFEVAGERVEVTASVEAIWKTGVEMEALTAASVAALTLYDMLKPIEKNLVIERVELEEKIGGKSDFQRRVPKGFRAAVIVVSDGTHEGTREDKSGRIIRERLESFGVESSYEVLPDEENRVVEALRRHIEAGTDLVLTTGGTGLGPRDVTVEAARRVIETEVPGVMEAARSHGQARTPYAMLSRGVAGVCRKTMVVTLPGSSRGVEESMDAIFPAVLHAFAMMQGRGH